jgi:hypothetical protein
MVEHKADISLVRVQLPYHLRNLTSAPSEVQLEIEGRVTAEAIIDALEAQYPAMRGTVREYASGQRRAYLRFFACGEDLSHQPLDAELPEAVANGEELFRIVGAISGG